MRSGLWRPCQATGFINLPQRFGLEYVAEDGSRKQPVMVHRALFGSVERFFGVLIEHYAGAFPLWLAPLQIGLVPISELSPLLIMLMGKPVEKRVIPESDHP